MAVYEAQFTNDGGLWDTLSRRETATLLGFAFAFISCMVGVNTVDELVCADRPDVFVKTSQSVRDLRSSMKADRRKKMSNEDYRCQTSRVRRTVTHRTS